MQRFFQRIAEKAKDVTQPPVIIVALGDSVTQGVMEHTLLDAEGVYHRLLQRELEAFYPTTTFSVINAGVSGGSAPQALERLDRDVLRHDPDLVLVAFGLNDSLGGEAGVAKFEQAIGEIIRRVRASTQADLTLLTPSFMARQKNFRIHPVHEVYAPGIIAAQGDGSVARYAESLRKIARENGVPLADVHREWQRLAESGFDTDLWLCNGLNHPDRRGHRLAAITLLHTLLSHRP